MNAYHKKQKQKKRKSIFRKWHRRLGFAASIFLLNLAVTGVLLNHYESLGLQNTAVESNLLLNWYQIKAPTHAQCYSIKSAKLCQLDNLIYFNKQFIQKLEMPLKTAILNDEFFVVATNRELLLLTYDGQLIDQVKFKALSGSPIIFESVELVASHQNRLLVELNQLVFQVDWDNYSLTAMPSVNHERLATWQKLPANLQVSQGELVALAQDYRQRQLSWLKVIQDLHSGSILGLSGKVTNDITALILILLALSGFITWRRRKHPPAE
ncbi:PepSY domain-containing protein [Aliikangiella sp. IMCC44653]